MAVRVFAIAVVESTEVGIAGTSASTLDLRATAALGFPRLRRGRGRAGGGGGGSYDVCCISRQPLDQQGTRHRCCVLLIVALDQPLLLEVFLTGFVSSRRSRPLQRRAINHLRSAAHHACASVSRKNSASFLSLHPSCPVWGVCRARKSFKARTAEFGRNHPRRTGNGRTDFANDRVFVH